MPFVDDPAFGVVAVYDALPEFAPVPYRHRFIMSFTGQRSGCWVSKIRYLQWAVIWS